MLNFFIIVSTLVFGFVGLMGRSGSWTNVFFKLFFIVFSGIGIFLILEQNGYIIKQPSEKPVVEKTCQVEQMSIGQLYCDERDNEK
jgi:hypothetical protein